MNRIWIAYPERFEKTLKMVVYDEKGTVGFDHNKVLIKSKSNQVELPNDTELAMVRSKFGWGNFSLVMLITLVYPMIRQQSAVFTTMLLLFVIGVFLFLHLKHKWIKISFIRGTENQVVYISDSSGDGWGGIFGGTEKLFNQLQLALDQSE